MSEQIPFPVLHVHLGPASPRDAPGRGPLAELTEALEAEEEVRQSAVLGAPASGANSARGKRSLAGDEVRTVDPSGGGLLPAGLRPGTLLAVGRALAELVADPAGGRRAVQWPAPERWAVVHAHGAAALRAVWAAAAWRGRNPRLLATPLPGDGSAPAGLWRKAELVTAPDAESRESLARRGVERRRLRMVPPGDAAAHLRLYRRLATGERRRVQRVDWSLADAARDPGKPRKPGSRP